MVARIAVVGSLNMDLVARVPRIPRPGETLIGGEFRSVPGGKGANQAVAAARLGATVTMVGRVGQDAFAGPLRANLAAAGIEHTFVSSDAAAATGVALIVVAADGENSIVVAPGVNMRLAPADVEAATAVIAGADALLLQLEIPLAAVIQAAQIAHAHGVRVILNPAPARSLPGELLALVDVLIPNESETALLTGLPVDNQTVAATAAATLLSLGVGNVILTLGERGAMLAQSGTVEFFPAFEVVPVDTTAAGDAFVGGFAVALAEGKSLATAVRWGNGAGGLAATKLGSQPSLPTRQDLEKLLATGANK